MYMLTKHIQTREDGRSAATHFARAGDGRQRKQLDAWMIALKFGGHYTENGECDLYEQDMVANSRSQFRGHQGVAFERISWLA